ncbi:hypothetical protein A3B19_03145 [Candidatus Giovannonibacteria bacterium RIFCSPLOWO2_01_FULL_46_32]|uniref:Uncharacterized protein n=1 Tax=Candidatus Giovannonibacteria bacterium RIFCSPLOWO2_01_FULL_46_32 TaxID=1798353 RepID=A0A1F5XHB1_9BACT|nr:MAG: hypothetical protein A3B19_03145 [Candidatus Giovannonibacteria bacterium RIFCSPLOWO2_01_FULL_46_32]
MTMLNKNMITVVAILILIAGAVWWLLSSGGDEVAISQKGETEGPALELVRRLKNIKIDTAFFNDAQFLELEATPKTSLEGISKGKTNPFRSAR